MADFTPGPWETLDLGEALIVQPTDKSLHPICLVDRQKNVVANAAIIAAAPEMYEALIALRQWTQAEIDHFEGSTPDDFIWDKVNSALAKAEGKKEAV